MAKVCGMKSIVAAFFLLAFCSSGRPQTALRDEPTNILESGYSVITSSRGYTVNVALILSNPFENRFASNPKVQVVLRANNGSILTSRELNAAGIPPKNVIALCESIHADQQPAKVEFRALSASYEETDLKPSEFKQFTLLNMNSRENTYGGIQVTGEVKNPYRATMGAWVCFLFRDKEGKLIGGHNVWLSEVPSGEPFAFDTSVSLSDLPTNISTIEKAAFSDFNFQSSWRKVLRP